MGVGVGQAGAEQDRVPPQALVWVPVVPHLVAEQEPQALASQQAAVGEQYLLGAVPPQLLVP